MVESVPGQMEELATVGSALGKARQAIRGTQCAQYKKLSTTDGALKLDARRSRTKTSLASGPRVWKRHRSSSTTIKRFEQSQSRLQLIRYSNRKAKNDQLPTHQSMARSHAAKNQHRRTCLSRLACHLEEILRAALMEPCAPTPRATAKLVERTKARTLSGLRESSRSREQFVYIPIHLAYVDALDALCDIRSHGQRRGILG
jgi:hypothetical protein